MMQGGVKAVVYTDVFQTLTMLFGVLAVIAVICVDFGGVDEIRKIAMEGGRMDMFKYVTVLSNHVLDCTHTPCLPKNIFEWS